MKRLIRKIRIALALTFSQPLWLPGISGGAYDSSQMLRAASAGNLTATETTASQDIKGTPARGVIVRVHVPAFVAATTLDVKIQESDSSGSGFTDLLNFIQVAAVGDIGERRKRLTTSKRYVRAVLTVVGGAANFGAVQVGFDTGGEQQSW